MEPKYKIINLITSSVSIDDIGVHLPGKGSYKIVNHDVFNSSKDFKLVKNLVKVEIVKESTVPFWPFIKSVPIPASKTEQESKPVDTTQIELLKSVKKIEEVLNELLSRPSPPPPEIIAAHVAQIKPGSEVKIPSGPMFIPSKIRPTDVKEIDVDISSKDIRKDDIDNNVDLLKSMRTKK